MTFGFIETRVEKKFRKVPLGIIKSEEDKYPDLVKEDMKCQRKLAGIADGGDIK